MFNLSTKTHGTRFSRKIDKVFWLIISALPLILYFVAYFHNSPGEIVSFADFMEFVPTFPFIQDIMDNVTLKAFGAVFAINGYLSYCVGVEIMHVLFDIVVFIPRFAHKIISNAIEVD